MSHNIVRYNISIVVPAYNEEESLNFFYKKLILFLPPNYEIIFVDDGSDDRSCEVIQKIHQGDARVKLIRLSRNMGHQIALTAGLDYAEGDAVITMDADLQHPPELIPKMLKSWEEGYDIINMVKEKTVKRGRMKDLLAALFYHIFNKISDIYVNPHASDFRLFDKRCVEAIRQVRDHQRFIRGFASWIGFKHLNIQYVASERHAGQPKYTLSKLFTLAAQGFFSFTFFPLKFPIYAGLFITGISLIHLFIFIVIPLYSGHANAPQGWTTLVFLQTLFGGINLIILGVMGIYLGQIFIETKKRPLYFVKDLIGFKSER